jgi:long-subunit acyl-CoA synthetase (AMP-forming)
MSDVEKEGSAMSPVPKYTREDDLFTIIHTSGSTGIPKVRETFLRNLIFLRERYIRAKDG